MIEAVQVPTSEDSSYAKQWATLFLLLSSPQDVDVAKVEQLLRKMFPDWKFDVFASYKTVATTKDIAPSADPRLEAAPKEWASGPWAGQPATYPYVAAIKVNARTWDQTPVDSPSSYVSATARTTADSPSAVTKYGAAMDVIRTQLKPMFRNAFGYEVVHQSFKPWGSPLSLDKGLPPTPPLPPPEAPPEEKKDNAWVLWLIAGTAAATAYAYSRK